MRPVISYFVYTIFLALIIFFKVNKPADYVITPQEKDKLTIWFRKVDICRGRYWPRPQVKAAINQLIADVKEALGIMYKNTEAFERVSRSISLQALYLQRHC
jgi:hypothetical protein